MFYCRILKRFSILIKISKPFPVVFRNYVNYCTNRKLAYNIIFRQKNFLSVTYNSPYSTKKVERGPQLLDEEAVSVFEEELIEVDDAKEKEEEEEEEKIISDYEIKLRESRSENLIRKLEEAPNDEKAELGLNLLVNKSFTNQFSCKEKRKFAEKIWNILAANLLVNERFCEEYLICMTENYGNINTYLFLSDLIKNHITVTEKISLLLLKSACDYGKKSEMDFIVETMKEKELPLTNNVDYLLMFGNARAGDLIGAMKIYQKLESEGDQSQERQTAYLKALACVGRESQLIEQYKYLQRNNITLTDEDIFGMIEALLISNHLELIQNVLKWKQRFDLKKLKNFIVKLLRLDYDGVAIALTPALSIFNSEDPLFVSSVMKSAVKTKVPFEDLVSICKLLISKKASEYTLHFAAGYLLKEGLVDKSIKMFEIIKNQGFPLRPHYFWPLLAKLTNEENYDGAFKILEKMKDLNVDPHKMVFYYFRRLDPDVVVFKVHEAAGWDINVVVQSFLINRIIYLPLKQLADFLSIRKLKEVYKKVPTRHVSIQLAFVVKRRKNVNFEDLSKVLQSFDPKIYGEFLISLAKLNPDVSIISSVLEMFWKENLKISEKHAQILNSVLPLTRDKLKDSIDRITDKMLNAHNVNSDEKKVPDAAHLHKKIGAFRTQKYFEDLLKEARKADKDVSFILCNLLNSYVQCGEFKKAADIRDEILKLSLPLSAGIKSKLFILSIHEKDLENSLSYYEDLITNHSDFGIDRSKIIDFANLLMKNDLNDEAFKVLNFNHLKVPQPVEKLQAHTIRFLKNVAEKGDPVLYRKCVDVLVHKGYARLDARLFAPLMQWYLKNDELPKACEEFELCVVNHKIAPLPMQLLMHLLKIDHKKKLKKIQILLSKVHNSSRVNVTMCFALAELNRVQELQNYYEQHQVDLLNNNWGKKFLEYYSDKGISNPLECLFMALHPSKDSEQLIPFIFRSFDKNEDRDRPSKFLNMLNEKNIHFPEEYIKLLASKINPSIRQ